MLSVDTDLILIRDVFFFVSIPIEFPSNIKDNGCCGVAGGGLGARGEHFIPQLLIVFALIGMVFVIF